MRVNWARARLVAVVVLIGVTFVALPHGSVAADGDAGRVSAAHRDPSADPSTRSPVPVLAFFYQWFDRGSWNRAKIDYPTLGRYSSDDVAVIRQQINWAKSAGIDGFVVSWKDTPTNNRRLHLLMSVAKEMRFSLAMIYQGLDFERRPQPVARVAADLLTFRRVFAPDPVFLRLGGKALTIWSGTWSFSREEIGSATGPVRDRLLVLATERNVEGYQRVRDVTDGDAYYWSSINPESNTYYEQKLVDMSRAIHQDGKYWMAPFAPGFDARLVGGTKRIERRDGQTLRVEYAAAVNSSPDLLGLISWNEFSENSHVEPSVTHGARYLDVLRELRDVPPPPLGQDLDSSQSSSPAEAEPDRDWSRAALLLGFPVILIVGVAIVTAVRRRRRVGHSDP